MSEHKTGKPAGRRIVLTEIKVYFESGEYLNLDPHMVDLVDRKTRKPLFEAVIEGNV